MEMTTREIVLDYKNSITKSKQINILAQLNNCTPDEIRAELIKGGVPEREIHHKKTKIRRAK